MIVCFCTGKKKGEVQKRIEELVAEGAELSTELVSEVHKSFSEGDAEMGRCFGCFDEVEEMIFDHIRLQNK